VRGASPSQRAWRNDAPSCRNSTKRLSSMGTPCLAERLRMGTHDLGIATRAPSSWEILPAASFRQAPAFTPMPGEAPARSPAWTRPRSRSWRYRPASALTTPLPVLVSSSRRQRLRFRDRARPLAQSPPSRTHQPVWVFWSRNSNSEADLVGPATARALREQLPSRRASSARTCVPEHTPMVPG
jgi:hypothetical protein